MHRIVIFRIANKNIHLPKLIGAIVLIIAILMIFQSVASIVDTVEDVRSIQNCYRLVTDTKNDVLACQANAESYGIPIRSEQTNISTEQLIIAIINPLVALLSWCVLFLLGLMFYRSGKLVIPIEEVIKDIPEIKEKGKN